MVSIKYIDLRIRSVIPSISGGTIDFPWMNIMLSGRVEYLVDGVPVMLSEGNVAYFKAGNFIARKQQVTYARYLSIRFTTDFDDSHIQMLTPILGERQNTLITMLQSYYFGNDLGEIVNRHAAELVLELILQELHANCCQTVTGKRIAEIRNYVLGHFSEGIKPQSVAKHFSLHPSYCNTLYKNATGETIGQLIDRVRIKHATSRLLYSQLSISEIALECGFKDLYYFSRWFRHYTMISPTDYRQKGQETIPYSLVRNNKNMQIE